MVDEISKNKAITVSAIMNNSKLFKVVSDALNAPPGSSKREKAASILSVFNKGDKSRILDGKGGMPDNPDMATLYGPSGQKTPVQVGSQQASELQSQGWGLTEGSYVDPEPTPIKSKVLFGAYPQEKEQFTEMPWAKDAPNIKMFEEAEGVAAPTITPTEEQPSAVPDYSNLIDQMTAPTQGYDDWYQNLSEEDKDLFKPFYESAMAGFGPQTAAWKLMEDTDRLKKMGVPTSLLPTHGASLVGQVSSLADTLREETGLTRTENNLKNLQERGLSISDDLTAYISSKDKYIKNINKLMDGAREHEEKIDMSLPENQRTMKNYNNYLHILKGRQQKRYIDFLNSGITYHNAELTRADNAYNTAYQNFTRELSTQTALTKENYERLNNILMDMYSNIIGREEKEIEKQLLANELLQSNYKTMEDQINYIKLFTGEADTGWSKLTDTTQAQAEGRYIKSSNKTAEEASSDFYALPDAEKLQWISTTEVPLTEDITSYAKEILAAAKGVTPSPYYDEEKEMIRWDKLPDKIERKVKTEYARIIADLKQKQAIAAGDEKAKSMSPLKWFKYFFNFLP